MPALKGTEFAIAKQEAKEALASVSPKQIEAINHIASGPPAMLEFAMVMASATGELGVASYIAKHHRDKLSPASQASLDHCGLTEILAD